MNNKQKYNALSIALVSLSIVGFIMKSLKKNMNFCNFFCSISAVIIGCLVVAFVGAGFCWLLDKFLFSKNDTSENTSSTFFVFNVNNGKKAYKRQFSTAKRIIVKSDAQKILSTCFSGCSELSEIYFTNEKTEIDESAFAGCIALKKIKLPSELNNIQQYTFAFCESLPEISIPKSVENIGEYAFFGCSSLSRVEVKNTKIDLIGKSAFEGCKFLSEITLPKSIKTIGKSAFKDCKSLKNLTIPESVESIEEDAFAGCESLVLEFQSTDVNKVNALLEKSGISNDQKINFNGRKKFVADFKKENAEQIADKNGS
ncbi:MAG: leucine-rich repeat domain-containing protein [Treponema sp.]|nr:leucine-rich repeat domain-containing protein [Treponema sp.]